jgi:hypothetical protein
MSSPLRPVVGVRDCGEDGACVPDAAQADSKNVAIEPAKRIARRIFGNPVLFRVEIIVFIIFKFLCLIDLFIIFFRLNGMNGTAENHDSCAHQGCL